MDLRKYIREIPDFPKQGIGFKDITPLLGNPQAFAYAAKALEKLVIDNNIDKVLCMEARGFFFGSILAQSLNAGFVPVRKKGKLPYKVLQESYSLEYGNEILEIHKDAVLPKEKVLIHDDVLASGGTAKAVCNLVERLGGEIIQCNFLIELDFLNGRQQLNAPVASLISY